MEVCQAVDLRSRLFHSGIDDSLRILHPDCSMTLGIPNAGTQYHKNQTTQWPGTLPQALALAPKDPNVHHFLGL